MNRDRFFAAWASVGVHLKDVNRNVPVRCPFHHDQCPSLSIHPRKMVWKCFAGCGQGGLRDIEQLAGCTSFSSGTGRTATTREVRSCSVPVLLREGGRPRVVRVACHRRSCAECAPDWREKTLHHFGDVLEGTGRIYRLEIPKGWWNRTAQRIRRCGENYVKVPLQRNRVAVYTSVPMGDAVGIDVYRVLEDDLTNVASRGNVSSSREWALPKMEPKAVKPEFLGVLHVPWSDVMKNGMRYGVLKKGWGNGFELDDSDEEQWRRFCAAIRLRKWAREPSEGERLARILVI